MWVFDNSSTSIYKFKIVSATCNGCWTHLALAQNTHTVLETHRGPGL